MAKHSIACNLGSRFHHFSFIKLALIISSHYCSHLSEKSLVLPGFLLSKSCNKPAFHTGDLTPVLSCQITSESFTGVEGSWKPTQHLSSRDQKAEELYQVSRPSPWKEQHIHPHYLNCGQLVQ